MLVSNICNCTPVFRAGFIIHYKTLTVRYEALPLEEQAWRLHKQQEGVQVCKEKELELFFHSELHL